MEINTMVYTYLALTALANIWLAIWCYGNYKAYKNHILDQKKTGKILKDQRG